MFTEFYSKGWFKVSPDLNISGVTSANDLLRRLGAEQILVLLQRLGFWVGGDRPQTETHAFPTNLSKLSSEQLGDEASYWQSELSRVIAVMGALEGRRLVGEFDVKRARNTATARLLREYRDKDKKPPAAAVLAAEVSTLPEVSSCEDALLGIQVVMTSLAAAKEAVEGYCRTLSREISRRGDLLRSGVERR